MTVALPDSSSPAPLQAGPWKLFRNGPRNTTRSRKCRPSPQISIPLSLCGEVQSMRAPARNPQDSKDPPQTPWKSKKPKGRPLRSCVHASTVGLPWVGLVLAHRMDALWDCDLGNVEAGSILWALCHVPQAISEQFFGLWRSLVLLGRALPWGPELGLQQCSDGFVKNIYI